MYGLTTLPTGITVDRLAMLIGYSWMVSEKPGAFAEFGVCQGGSLDLLARLHPERLIYGIDSFEGLPEPGKYDTFHKKGDFALSNSDIDSINDWFTTGDNDVIICPGFSPEIFKEIPPHETFAFVHIDVDLYQSVKDALDYFYPRLVAGGMMIFDDYGFETTPGAKKAIDEWFSKCFYRGEIVYNTGHKTGQYLVVK
jgi:O-methyltransferase